MHNIGKIDSMFVVVWGTALALALLQTSCGPSVGQFQTAVPGGQVYGSLFLQQVAAYPLLEESEMFTVLCDFETADQVEYFELTRSSGALGEACIFDSGSPTGTGKGALGVRFTDRADYTLVFTPNIKRWVGNNLWEIAIYSQEDQVKCAIELTGGRDNNYARTYLLRRGWNKLQIDLTGAAGQIALSQVKRVTFTFEEIGESIVCLDDLILLQHAKPIVGTPDGPSGKLYAVRQGRRIRIGASKRFELVFFNGKIVEWYDLASDTKRINNLAPAGGLGPFLYELDAAGTRAAIPAADTVTSVHSQVSSRPGGTKVKLAAEVFFGAGQQSGRPADQTFTYTISGDGTVDLRFHVGTAAKKLAVEFAVAGDRGFDAKVGRIRNRLGPSGSTIEYGLLRRMGAKAGSDLLVVFRPWKAGYLPVGCRVPSSGGQVPLRIAIESEAEQGGNYLEGLMRIWPTDIDHLGNAERYVRDFVGESGRGLAGPEYRERGSSWSPTWPVENGKSPSAQEK